jgi:hypothetical protein
VVAAHLVEKLFDDASLERFAEHDAAEIDVVLPALAEVLI